jgi:hypothetical protein
MSAQAEPDIWRKLLRVMDFSKINRATLVYACRETPQYKSTPKLVALCAKRDQIPNHVIEDAALPYLKRHVTERVAKQAILELSTDASIKLSDKLNLEIASGKQDLLSEADLVLLKRRNETEYGRALSAFASDKEQGRAVSRALLDYNQ